jgi:hypothetical protein
MAHWFLAEYGRGLKKIIRRRALGWEGRGYWGKAGSEKGLGEKSGKLMLGNPHQHWEKMKAGEKVLKIFPKSGKRPMF